MTPKKLVFLAVLGLADCTPGREPRSVAASLLIKCVVFTVRRLCVEHGVCYGPVSVYDTSWCCVKTAEWIELFLSTEAAPSLSYTVL